MIALIPGCLMFAILFLREQRRQHKRLAVVLKGLASLCFVALGLLSGARSQTARLIQAGLCLGCAADVILGLRNVFSNRRKVFFLAGGVVFLCGHILYLTSVWPLLERPVLCVITGLLAAWLLLRWLFRRLEIGRSLKAFGCVYFGFFLILESAAISNAFTAPGAVTACFALGTLLFLLSDIILNLYSFGTKRQYPCRVAYCLLYYIGQLLIALSLSL